MGPKALHKVLKCSFNEASSFLSSFLNSYPDTKIWMENVSRKAESDGFVSTLTNRRRKTELGSNTAVNTVIQGRLFIFIFIFLYLFIYFSSGSAADILKNALISLHNYLVANDLHTVILPVASIHDEILCEVKEDLAEAFSRQLTQIMKSAGPKDLTVELECSVKIGKTWQDVK